MCDLISQDFHPNSETLQADFFAQDDLPKLALGKNSLDQIEMCFEANKAYQNNEVWTTLFD